MAVDPNNPNLDPSWVSVIGATFAIAAILVGTFGYLFASGKQGQADPESMEAELLPVRGISRPV